MSDPKIKGTLFSSTLKVQGIKVHLFSWLELILVTYSNFVVSWRNQKTPHEEKMTKGSYLPQMVSDPKNKGTLFSSTLKVKEKKVPLFF